MLFFHQIKYVSKNLIRQKTYSIINILGLAVAMASIVIIALWVMNELSFDKSYPKTDRIYRFTEERNTPDGYQSHFARIQGNIPIEKYLPEIEAKLRLAPLRYTTITIGRKKFSSDKIYFAETVIFKVFDLKLLQGDTSSTLAHPNSIIISEKTAKTYFGQLDCIGTTIQVLPNHAEKPDTYTITGVFKDLPTNSHLHFDLLASFQDSEKYNDWAYNYVLLNKNTRINELRDKLPQIVNEFYSEKYAKYFKFHLQSIKDIHLHSKKEREIEQNGNYQSVILLIAAAIFIFLIALINSINLNITLLFKEFKYLKLNKVFGAKAMNMLNIQLIKAVIISVIASVISLIFISSIQCFLDNVFWLNSSFLENQEHAIFLILISLTVLMLVFSSLPVFLIVKNKISGNSLHFDDRNLLGLFNTNNKFLFRKLLLIVQFAVSFILIVCSAIINLQMNLISSNQLELKGARIVVLKQLPTPIRNDYADFKHELLQSPFVKGVTASMETPPSQIMDGANFEISGQTEDQKTKSIYINPVDDTYFKFYDQKIISGEDFPIYTEGQAFDNYIINETAMKYLGYENPEEIVGKKFKIIHGMIDFKEGKIIGVVNDFYYTSLHHQIEPMVYFQRPQFYFSFYIKIDSTNVRESLTEIQTIWEKVYPDYPFEYNFSDQLYQQAYVNEYTQTKLSGRFSVVAMVISFTGLIGLTSIMANRRKKEIGIRKVIGASSFNIAIKLSSEFFQMIIIASLIAISVSYLLMDKWLQNFVYRIDLIANWWIFILIFVALTCFVMLIVTFKAFISSRINPVECIRNE